MTIGIGYLWDNSPHSKIRKSLLGRAIVGSCHGLSNRCRFVLANQQSESYAPATEVEIIRFLHFPFRELLWNLSTQVNIVILDSWITVFDPSMGKLRCFITFLFYALFYPIISSILATLANLSPWSDSIRMHTCSPFLIKLFLR